jgi:hypothetical protein
MCSKMENNAGNSVMPLDSPVFGGDAPQRLTRGYYFVRARGRFCRKSWLMVFQTEQAPVVLTKAPLELGGLFLLRVREPVSLALEGDSSAEPPRFHVHRLPAVLAAIVKLIRSDRKRRFIIAGGGCLRVLSGVTVSKTMKRIHEYMGSQASLAFFGLHDANIPAQSVFDTPAGWLPQPTEIWRPRSLSGGKAAVVLHLYYTDLWPEISAFLNQIQRPFELLVTCCRPDVLLETRICSIFPRARFWIVENRGRDVWPFIELLNKGVLNDFDYVCKIHGKKSAHRDGRGETLLGLRWRRRMLQDLLGGERAEAIMDMFDRNPRLGLVGPAAMRLPNAANSVDASWGSPRNRRRALALAARMGAGAEDAPLDFFAGSMFWITPAAIEPIRRLNLQSSDFPEEKGQLDGETQHALERLFSVSTRSAGRLIEDVPPLAPPIPQDR